VSDMVEIPWGKLPACRERGKFTHNVCYAPLPKWASACLGPAS